MRWHNDGLFLIMKFIADVHAGKLAKLMRMLGFDVMYSNSLSQRELVSISLNENRVLLSKSSALKDAAQVKSFIITAEDSETQLQQVIKHFNLKYQFHPFTKCIVCNGTLHAISKDEIIYQLQRNTIQYFNEFWQCDNCKRIYWKGSHYERMQQLIKKFIDD